MSSSSDDDVNDDEEDLLPLSYKLEAWELGCISTVGEENQKRLHDKYVGKLVVDTLEIGKQVGFN